MARKRSLQSEAPNLESPRLEEVTVLGFQGHRDFKIPLRPDVNFLIGRNGSGKTTLINLINAALQFDTQALLRSRFKSISLRLSHGPPSSRFTLRYTKGTYDGPMGESVELALLGPKNGELFSRVFRDRDRYYLRTLEVGTIWHDSSGLEQIFKAHNKVPPQITWLSLLRWENTRVSGNDSPQSNPIDRKLDELAVNTTRYLSALDSRSARLSAEFQKEYFLSLIGYKNSQWADISRTFSALDLDEEEKTLSRILSHLRIPPSEYEDKLKGHFNKARTVKSKVSSGFDVYEVWSLLDTIRVHELNDKWTDFEDQRKAVYRPKTVFTDIINGIFSGKELSFNERNLPVFSIGKNSHITLPELSSGEKQAYVILSEALNQEQKTAIYLADEPELSLHVEWQQFLVRNILTLNPSCQILFATHSPDILGRFGDHAIDVERL